MLALVGALAACGGKDNNNSNAAAGANLDTSSIKMGRVNYAAHGTKSFAVVVVAMAGDKIAGASIDEFQYLGKDVAKGVPNSEATGDGDFGTNVKDPTLVLASKRDNADYYSEHMKEAGGATKTVYENYGAIENFVVGKTVAELEDLLSKKSAEEMVDAVSGATLQDTKGYVTAIVDAAKTVK